MVFLRTPISIRLLGYWKPKYYSVVSLKPGMVFFLPLQFFPGTNSGINGILVISLASRIFLPNQFRRASGRLSNFGRDPLIPRIFRGFFS